MTADESPISIEEVRVTLRKFDGDPPQPGEFKEPVEVIVIEHGQIVAHMTRDQEEEETHGPR